MKKAIVIGATSGMGKGLAEILVQNNYKVGIAGRRTKLLEELKATNPEQYLSYFFDISDLPSIEVKLQEMATELGGLDLLVLSSGTGDLNDALDFTIEKQTIDTNVVGFTAVVDWTFNYFQQQKAGHLVAISSIAGLRGNHQTPAYDASKAFQINYLEGLHQKAHRTGYPITITDIRPGFIDTPMAKGNMVFWLSPVDKTVKQIYRAIKRKKSVAYVSRRWILLAYIFRIIPRCIYKLG